MKAMWGGFIYTYIPWPFPPVWGVANNNTKKTTKTMRVTLRSSSNDEGPDRVWAGTAGATQPILPRLSQLTLLHRCHLLYCPLSQGCLYKATP